MSTLTCGPNGSTVLEIVTEVNQQGEAIDGKLDKVLVYTPNNVPIFEAGDKLKDSGRTLEPVKLGGQPK